MGKTSGMRCLFVPSQLALAAIALPTVVAAGEQYLTTYTPTASGDVTIECVCVVPTATQLQCAGLSVLDLAAGKPRHTWSQTITARRNTAVNLSAACHRKAEVAGHGDGLCCSANASDVSRLFAAKVR